MVEKTEYYPNIKRFVSSRIRNPEDAEDLTQQVFFEYYKAKHRDNYFLNAKAYLFGTARKKISDYFRHKKSQPNVLQFNTELIENISDEKQASDSYAKEIIQDFEVIISKLPPKSRQAIKLIIIDNLSYDQAAQKADCSTKIFYDRFYEGIKIIKKKIHP